MGYGYEGERQAPKDGQLDDVTVQSDTAKFDRNGIIDNDYDRYERNINEKALEELANTYQDIGAIVSIIGIGLSLTVFGAPLGAVLIGVGTAFSWAGIGIELIEDVTDGGEFNIANHAINIGTEYLPDLFGNNFSNGTISLENLYIELGATGSDTWIDFMSDFHNKDK